MSERRDANFYAVVSALAQLIERADSGHAEAAAPPKDSPTGEIETRKDVEIDDYRP